MESQSHNNVVQIEVNFLSIICDSDKVELFSVTTFISVILKSMDERGRTQQFLAYTAKDTCRP